MEHTSPSSRWSQIFSDDSNVMRISTTYLPVYRTLPFVATSDAGTKATRSQKGKAGNKLREFKEALGRLSWDYFGPNPKYRERLFEQQFQVPRAVLDRIEQTFTGSGTFVQGKDVLKKNGIHPKLCITAALCMPAYSTAADKENEYL